MRIKYLLPLLAIPLLASACGGGPKANVGTQCLPGFIDNDYDGYGGRNNESLGAECYREPDNSGDIPENLVSVGGDCDDDDADLNPAAIEECDGIDNDCDGQVDDGLTISTYYPDGDGDGYGAGGEDLARQACAAPEGYVSNTDDCDNTNDSIYPDPSIDDDCDGKDNDCDGRIDEDGGSYYYLDSDGDLYGNEAEEVRACEPPPGYVSDSTDCDDTNPGVNPGAAEDCNGGDDNCDDIVDGITAPGDLTSSVWVDSDGDTYGDPTSETESCTADGYVTNGDDCDDGNDQIFPGATESCNDLDDDCDLQIDEGDVCVSGPTWSVFLLSGTHRGDDFGSVVAANAACEAEARVYGHTGSFRAWLSDSSNSPAADFTRRTTPYTLPSGTQIADDWTDLVDGTLDAPINETADGTIVASSWAWTGTEPDGTPSAHNCNNWTNAFFSYWRGGVGFTHSVDSEWTASATVCDASAVIYCFGQ